jgi:hypothetical protein
MLLQPDGLSAALAGLGSAALGLASLFLPRAVRPWVAPAGGLASLLLAGTATALGRPTAHALAAMALAAACALACLVRAAALWRAAPRALALAAEPRAQGLALFLLGPVVGLNLMPTSACQAVLQRLVYPEPPAGAGGRHRGPAPPPDADESVFGPIRVAAGDPVPDLTLEDLEGGEVRLADHVGRLPLVIEFGSFT